MRSNFFKWKHHVGMLFSPTNNNTEIIEDRFGSNACFLCGMRPVVILGRCFGALSRTDILGTDHEQNYRRINLALLYSILITLFIFIYSTLLTRLNLLKFQRDKTTLVKLEGFNHAGYAVSMFVIYLYQLFASVKLRNIVQSFLLANRSSQLPSFTGQRGISKYPIFSWIIIIICMTLGSIENAVFDWQSLHRGAVRNKTLSMLELYYTENFKHWHVIIPEYSMSVILVLVILTKLATWGWIYMDVVCVLLCRALWEKLSVIGEYLRWNTFEQQIEKKKSVKGNAKDAAHGKYADIYKEEYVMVSDLVEQVQGYISPLIVACYIANMYIVIVMMFNWIGPFSTEGVSREKTVHVCFAFFQFLFRMATITYFAGEVHQMCLEIRRKIQMCPNYMYTLSLERLERILISNPTGICIFGSFMITRKFFVSIVSFIFTTEIVLLQSYSGYYTVYSANATA